MKPYILAYFIFFIPITNAIGCSCLSVKESLKKKIKKEFLRSDIVFTGNVIAIKDLNTHPTLVSSGDPIQYTFEVIEQIKGVSNKRSIQIISARSGISCGYEFQIGKTYMVYAIESDYYSKYTENKSDYSTSLCTRNNHVARVSKKEKKLLKKLSRKSKIIEDQ